MNSPRQAKIFRDLWLYKTRTALVVLAMAVGVAASGMMFTARTVLQRDLAAGYAASRPAQAELTVSDFDAALLQTVAAQPQVQTVQPRRVVQAKVELAPGQWNLVEIQGLPDFHDIQVNKLTFPNGAALTPPDGAVLLDRSVVDLMDVAPGASLQVKTLQGVTHSLKVAGWVNDLEPLPSSISDLLNAYASMSTLRGLGEPQKYNTLDVIFKNAHDRPAIEQALTGVVKTVQDQGYTVYSAAVPEPGKPVLSDNMDTVLLIMGSLGVVILLASGFLITNVMSTLITQQIPQIGILKSLGGRSKQIMALYMEMVLILGGLALLLAVPLGLIGAYFMGQSLAESMDFDMLSFGLPLQTLLFQLAAAVLVPALAALVPVLGGSRLTIRQAISTVGLGDDFGQSPLGRLLARFGRLPRLLVLSIRNTFRQTGRLVLTLAALSLAGAMFIAVIGIRQSMQAAVVRLQQADNFDVQLDFDRPYAAADLNRVVQAMPGVSAHELWGVGDARRIFNPGWTGGSMVLIGLPPDTQMADLQVMDGRWLKSGDTRAVFLDADAVYANPGLVSGDKIDLAIGGQVQTYQVVGSGARGFVPTAYIPYAQFEQASGLAGYANRLVLQTEQHTPAYQSQVETGLLERFAKANITVSYSNTLADINQRQSAQLDTLIILLLVVSILIALVGGIGLASTSGMNVLERTREIGVLRSLGAQSRVIHMTVILEGLTVSLISTLLAILLSVPLAYYLGNALGETLLYVPLVYSFSLPGALIWCLLVIAITVVACWAPARAAARLTIRDALAYNG